MSLKLRVIIVIALVAAIGIVLLFTKTHVPQDTLKAGFDSEFLTRPDGYLGLKKDYGFQFGSEPVHLDPGLMYRALADGAVDVICAFATDGRIPAYGLKVLEDDRGFFPPYYAAPLIRSDTLDRYPELEEILNKLEGKLPDKTMQKLNYEVDEKGRKPYDVAREWLVSAGITKADAKPGDGSMGSITIGSKAFTEQELLGHLMAILIEYNTDIEVIRKLNLGGTMICFNALKAGDLDLYAEYTGTALMAILKRKIISDPDLAYKTVAEVFEDKFGLIFLEPFGFNNTYTLTMRKEQARALGIETISDLAEHVKRENRK